MRFILPIALILAAALFLLPGCSSCSPPQTSPDGTTGSADQSPKPTQEQLDAQPKSATDGPLSATIDRSAYLRYMIVHLTVAYSASGTSVLTAWVEKDGHVLPAVGDATSIDLIPDSEPGKWHGSWAMSWNPPLGECILVVKADVAGSTSKTVRIPFTIKKLDLPPPPAGMAVVTLESDSQFREQRIEGPDGKNVDWKGLLDWAHYMGASHFFYSVGITKARWGPTAEHPFKQYNIDLALELGQEAHRQGMQFGGWIGSYLPYGTTQVTNCGYQLSRNMSSSGVLLTTLHISLGDAKRKKDLTDLCRFMQQHDEFDWIGLDYIRSGFGGYELVDLFTREMGIPVPEDWQSRRLEKKMLWMLGELRGKRNQVMMQRWQWWRASYVARIVADIRHDAGITKPFFVFSLGWEMGHQHGQDPLMFNDAGAYDLVMLYEATRDEFDAMMRTWPTYLHADQGIILEGNCVDYNLLENRWAKGRPPPDEYYRRSVQAQDGMKADKGLVQGVFWHDLERALYLRRGPNYMPSDYALSGAATFTAFRNAQGSLPIKLELEPAGTAGGRFRLNVTVSNRGKDAVSDLQLTIARTNGTSKCDQSEAQVGTLAAGESKTVLLEYYAKNPVGEKLIPRWKRKLEAAQAEAALSPEEKKAKLQDEKDRLTGKKKKDKTKPEEKPAPTTDKTGIKTVLPFMVGVEATWKADYPFDRAFAYVYPALYKP
jgi:hypothetical protein